MTGGTTTLRQSPAQERLWFRHALDPGDLGYHVLGAYELRGALDVGALRRAVRGVVARHPALRARFPADEDPVQVIESDSRVILEEFTASSDLREHILAWLGKPFDLEAGPLMRIGLWRLGPEDHILALCLHHIVCDHFSWLAILDELGEFYADADTRIGADERLLEYRQHIWAECQAAEEIGGPPQAELAGQLMPLHLPPPHPGESPEGHGHLDADLPPGAVRMAESAARANGISPIGFHLGLTAGLAAFLCDTNDVVLTSPLTLRRPESSRSLVGCFVNLALLRLAVDLDEPVVALTIRARNALVDAIGDRMRPYQAVVAQLRAARQISGADLPFGLSYNYVADAERPPEFAGLTATAYPCPQLGLRNPFAVTVVADSLHTRIRLGWKRSLMSSRAAGAFAETYQQALVRLSTPPRQSLREVLTGLPLTRLAYPTR
ncbi:MAG TPA: condensation domain-containing protein [Mycobacterium sp.]|nr:condensation domain-containing protein [Mycobacterium sp.]